MQPHHTLRLLTQKYQKLSWLDQWQYQYYYINVNAMRKRKAFLVFQKADHLTSMEILILLISFFTSLQYSDTNLTISRNPCNLTICHSLMKILSLFSYVDTNNIVNNFGHHDTIRIRKIYRRKIIYPWWLYAAEVRCWWVRPSLHPS